MSRKSAIRAGGSYAYERISINSRYNIIMELLNSKPPLKINLNMNLW